jgi:Cu/Ag efflux pump CusA
LVVGQRRLPCEIHLQIGLVCAALGAFFTATSMIGFIAGAGIVVRNSIILVDFIELRLAEGMPLDQVIVDAAGFGSSRDCSSCSACCWAST